MNKKEYAILLLIALISILVGIFSSSEPLFSFLRGKFFETLNLMLVMVWETWWALVLGFAIAGGVEAWVSKEKIVEYMKGRGPKEIATGSFFGFVSSSCSYSAVSTAKNLFKKGASAVSSLSAFMLASTNLVIEIGLVMWALLGWQFVLADYIGGFILIIILALFFVFLIPDKIIEEARDHAIRKEGLTAKDPVCGMEVDPTESDHKVEEEGTTYYFCSPGCKDEFDPSKSLSDRKSIWENFTSFEGWKSLAEVQWKEWRMLWEDIIVGFILAGIIGAFIPKSVWVALFGGEFLGLPLFVLLTAILGTMVGIVTFVCSVGNVPFAAILWNNGLPFGSVLSFIYADLIIPPLMDAYKKYYGKLFALILSLSVFAAAVSTGFIIHFLFLGSGLIPTASAKIVEKSISLNYKAFLNFAFLSFFIFLFYIRER